MKLYYSSSACAISPSIALHEAGIDIETEFPNLYAFMDRMEERCSVKNTLKTEGIEEFTNQKSCAA